MVDSACALAGPEFMGASVSRGDSCICPCLVCSVQPFALGPKVSVDKCVVRRCVRKRRLSVEGHRASRTDISPRLIAREHRDPSSPIILSPPP